jgi:hypothetical protein
MQLPCGYFFDKKCILRALEDRNTCPKFRTALYRPILRPHPRLDEQHAQRNADRVRQIEEGHQRIRASRDQEIAALVQLARESEEPSESSSFPAHPDPAQPLTVEEIRQRMRYVDRMWPALADPQLIVRIQALPE